MIHLIQKAQNMSLEDQRGNLNSKSLELPDFLSSNNLVKTNINEQGCMNKNNLRYHEDNCINLSYQKNLILTGKEVKNIIYGNEIQFSTLYPISNNCADIEYNTNNN
jgi:hypothetical protein